MHFRNECSAYDPVIPGQRAHHEPGAGPDTEPKTTNATGHGGAGGIETWWA